MAELLHARYQLIEALPQGGGGQSYAALDTKSNQLVVVKELKRDLSNDAGWEREAEILKQLRHPQIPAFIDAFVEEVRLVPRLHLVMEHVDGCSLAEEMAARRYTEREALAIVSEVLAIVEYLHALSPPVVHRDLKPSNLMRRKDGKLVLIDFGTATDAIRRTLGHTLAVGTLGYVAPEQFVGEPVPASDVYSLGVVALELLTRRHPSELRSGDGLAWEKAASHLSKEIREWLGSALAPVGRRFSTAKQAREAIEPLLTDAPPKKTARKPEPEPKPKRKPKPKPEPASSGGVPRGMTFDGWMNLQAWLLGIGLFGGSVFFLGGLVCISVKQKRPARLEQACARGEPAACLQWAELLENGDYVARDRVRARTIYQRLCASGNADACQGVVRLSRSDAP